MWRYLQYQFLMMKINTTSNYVLEISWMLFILISIKMTHTDRNDTRYEKVDIENSKFNFSKERIDINNVIIECRYYYQISTLLVIKF